MPSTPAAERVALACRILGRLGLTREPAGHVSVREPDGRVLIKSRGAGESGLRDATAEDVVWADGDSGVPKEVFIHRALYRARPDIGAVVHIHPLTPVLFSVTGVPLLPLAGAYDPLALRLLRKGIPRYERSVLIADDSLGADLATVMGPADAVIMRGHGITAAGTDLEEAVVNAIKVNEIAELNYRARLLGPPTPLDDADLATFGDPPPHVGRQHYLSAWRQYANE
ncbi:class II aldolase/adducin family protein [Paractinoplanes globisporus]|uniref:Class II aldolase/adducin family protein n=1 Tax=Paractinoplanes globisporus TaxID=113565 RepID=A0ABW6WV45_9ACTN|nr:class II aldolase/adducin family protein [Actinoplanes globisporus]